MRKLYTVLMLFMILSCNLKNQVLSEKAPYDKNVVDSLKRVLKINDSIYVISNNSHSDSSFDFTIIDYNLNSKFHNNLKTKGDKWENYEIQQYKSDYDSIYPKIKELNKMRFPKEFQGKWYPLYSYKNGFYLYLPCQFFPIFEINDTALVLHGMDGNYARMLLEFKQAESKAFHFKIAEYNSVDNTVELKNVELSIYNSDKNIFLFKDKDKCSLIVNIRDINQFPIIVEGCTDLFTNQNIKFDEIKCK